VPTKNPSSRPCTAATPANGPDPVRRGGWSSSTGRSGTLAYLAAYDVHHAQAMGHIAPKIGIAPFTDLVAHVMTREPYASARRVFWIVDNGSSHAGQASIDRMTQKPVRLAPRCRTGCALDALASAALSPCCPRRRRSCRSVRSPQMNAAGGARIDMGSVPHECRLLRSPSASMHTSLPSIRSCSTAPSTGATRQRAPSSRRWPGRWLLLPPPW
jgi:hypothetical protein